MDFLNTKMRRQAMLVIFLVLFLAGCQPVSNLPLATHPVHVAADCMPGDHAEELTSGGQVREYRLHVPPAYQPEKPIALVLGFHGAASNSEQFESYSSFSSLADRAGFIVVYPQALGEHPTWNTTMDSTNADLQFVLNLLDKLQMDCNIDPNRIYASGHSNGGGMANRLACDLPDHIAAIGSVSGAYQWSENCSPSQAVAILAVHGTDDPIIPYNGFEGTGAPPSAYYLIGTPIRQWASAWAMRNGCNNQPSVIGQEERVSKQKWGDCRVGADVVLYTIQGGGHGWPAPDTLDAAQVIWEFFAQHPQSKASS